MANLSFSTENKTFQDLFGNGRICIVPPYQRDFSWESEQLDDLWQDMLDLDSKLNPAHYMGFIVLQSTDNKEFTIIDGQQRITTICLFILAAIKYLNTLVEQNISPENNKTRSEFFRSRYIGLFDPTKLSSESKLKLNHNNNDFFQNYIITLRDLKKVRLNASEKLLKKAFEWFYEKISKKFISDNAGEELAGFTEQAISSLFFSIITVTDELNAFKVFETLNSRGISLSSTDLLKNYLFSILSDDPHEMNQLERRWQTLINNLGETKFPTFVRTYWNSFNIYVRKTDLFKEIRKTISNSSHVTELIRQLEDTADVYMALNKNDDEFWTDYEDVPSLLSKLSLFKVSQPLSMLISGYNNLNKIEFTKLLKTVCIISFRYNIIGKLNPNELEAIYNKIAIEFNNSKKYSDVLPLFKKIYVPDGEFKATFANKSIKLNSRNKKIIRYILASIEKQESGIDHNYNSESYSIEHIYPQNPSDNWSEIDASQIERIGNYTLLSKSSNKDIGNLDFDSKQNCFKESEFALTKRVAEEYFEWTSREINDNQKWLANKAATVWKVTELQ